MDVLKRYRCTTSARGEEAKNVCSSVHTPMLTHAGALPARAQRVAGKSTVETRVLLGADSFTFLSNLRVESGVHCCH